MELLCISIAVAVVYFPIVWIAGKVAGNFWQNAAIVSLIAVSLALIFAVPIGFFLFLRYGLPLL